MRALLFQVDGKLPNLALMRLSAHLKAEGAAVEFRRTGQPERTLWEMERPDAVYGSTLFTSSRPTVERIRRAYPNALVGGTGVRIGSSLAELGITSRGPLDYSLYPKFRSSIGFTQRGCRLKCPFCVVPEKQGRVQEEATIYDIWRGEPHPRELLLLDNDFFGQPNWCNRIAEIREGRFRVSFSQGINIRCLTEEAAEAIASVDYRDDGMSRKRLYTAWDNRADEKRLFAGRNRLLKHGVKPDHVMVYMLIGYWPGETDEDRLYRQRKLRDFGCRPYPMPFMRTAELVGFQRWVIGAYDKRIPWSDWKQANCRLEKLGMVTESQQLKLVQISP
jgi:MoaA/NifB/PqqE/SkfB family radical SAM enzyme